MTRNIPRRASLTKRTTTLRPLVVLIAFMITGTLFVGYGDASPSEDENALYATTDPWQGGLATYVETPPSAMQRPDDVHRSPDDPGDPRYAAFDAEVLAIMARYDIAAGQIALMHDGELRYTRGYGHIDRAGTIPTTEDTLFRGASLTKPMTGAVASLQVQEGLYDWTDPVFCLPPDPAPGCRLTIETHPDKPLVDERLRDITVAQLVDHTAGWGRSGDPHAAGYGLVEVAETLGVPTPPPAWRLVQFILGEPLAYDPGSTFEYCNMCYIVLGLVAESAGGATLSALYDAYLFRPLGIEGDIEPGYGRPEDRNPREPFYACEGGDWGNAYEPGVPVCPADGALALETTIFSAGGLIHTASAVAAVHWAYPSEFQTALGPIHLDFHTGAFPGTAAWTTKVNDDLGLSDTTQYVFLFNKIGYDDPLDGPTAIGQLEFAILPLAMMWGASENILDNTDPEDTVQTRTV